ncbi:hypothetical protein OPQ81_008062 [Rhizoctonia solani]|nr:hypothetical protein OPQ81_008062 [Rhizoctonia solani]
MAPFHGFSSPSEGCDANKKLGWHEEKQLDHGAAIFLEQIQQHATARRNKGKNEAGPGVRGGLPPHLLRQHDEQCAVATANAGCLDTPEPAKAPVSVSKPKDQQSPHSYLEERASNFYGFKTVHPGKPHAETPQHSRDQGEPEKQGPGAVAHDSSRHSNASLPVGSVSTLRAPSGMNQDQSSHQQPSSPRPSATPARAYPEPSRPHAVYSNDKGTSRHRFLSHPPLMRTISSTTSISFLPTRLAAAVLHPRV